MRYYKINVTEGNRILTIFVLKTLGDCPNLIRKISNNIWYYREKWMLSDLPDDGILVYEMTINL